MTGAPFVVRRLGRMPYGEALSLQEELQAARIGDEAEDTLLLVEHDPVITLGRAAKHEHVLLSEAALASAAVPTYEVGRGGDVTYHGPGQLVAYPILDLKPDRRDVRKYVWTLEEIMVRIAADYGLAAGRVSGLNGTWVAGNKIGAVGVRIRQWVTMHGFALNVNTDLSGFGMIVPCGIQDRGVTSLARELGHEIPLDEVEERVIAHATALWGNEWPGRSGRGRRQ